MTEPTRGYIEAQSCYPSKSTWDAYAAFCRAYGVPAVVVAHPHHWKVEISACTMTGGRFPPGALRWFRDRLKTVPRAFRYPIISPTRVVAYGLTHADARRLAGEIVDAFPTLRAFTWYPSAGRAAIAADPPRFDPPGPYPARRGEVVDLAAERRRRRPFHGPNRSGPA